MLSFPAINVAETSNVVSELSVKFLQLTYDSCDLKISLGTKSENSFQSVRLYMTKLHSVLTKINWIFRADFNRTNIS